MTNNTKYIFVTGGVLSSLGKGITAASVGTLLKHSGKKVGMLKIDPYINVDPGTMSPLEHGEVFVTKDGAETDLDIGNYERFLDTCDAKKGNNFLILFIYFLSLLHYFRVLHTEQRDSVSCMYRTCICDFYLHCLLVFFFAFQE